MFKSRQNNQPTDVDTHEESRRQRSYGMYHVSVWIGTEAKSDPGLLCPTLK